MLNQRLGRWSAAACLCFWAGPAAASFENTPSSIKAEALGGAFVPMADDPSAVFVNPAGLTQLPGAQATMMYGQPLLGLENVKLSAGYLAFAAPLSSRWSLGVGATTFRAGGLLSEYQGAAALAARPSSWLSLGLGLSYFYHDYEISGDPAYAGDDAFDHGSSRGAVGAHLGAMVSLRPGWQAGLAVLNVNTPDVGLKEADRLPREIKIGSLYRWTHARLLVELANRDGGAETGTPATLWKLGVEIPVQAVSLRLGLNNNSLSGGFGLRVADFEINYALSLLRTVSASNYGTQLLALSYHIGGDGEAAPQRPRARKRTVEYLW